MTGYALEERVFVHGLTSDKGRLFNLQPARVVRPLCDEGERIGVELLGGRGVPMAKRRKGGPGKLLSLKPCNLLRASVPEDRRQLLLEQVVAAEPRLLAVRRFLDQRLPCGAGGSEDNPLLHRIAGFLTGPRQFPHQFSGFMGQVLHEHWRYDRDGRPTELGTLCTLEGGDAKPLEPRLDAAAAAVDSQPGMVLFAGGCGDHPRRCQPPHGFFKSAVLYDSLLDEWRQLPDMPTRRHGASAAAIGDCVYVMGGQYVDDRSESDAAGDLRLRFMDTFDVSAGRWRSQPDDAFCHVSEHLRLFVNAAFFAADAVGGRLVCCLPPDRRGTPAITMVFNPSREGDGWRVAELPEDNALNVHVGSSGCASTFGNEFVVVSGRPATYARRAAAFRFTGQLTEDTWYQGCWRRPPDIVVARVGGALTEIEGRLYVSGGVDEQTGDFRDDFERLDEHCSPPCWAPVPGLRMPRALHAQRCVALPSLAPPCL